jgi:hypothetical protein
MGLAPRPHPDLIIGSVRLGWNLTLGRALAARAAHC